MPQPQAEVSLVITSENGLKVATVAVTQVEHFKAAQFDMVFPASPVQIEKMANGEIGGVWIPTMGWNWLGLVQQSSPQAGVDRHFRILGNLPVGTFASGSGYLAKVVFSLLEPPHGNAPLAKLVRVLLVNDEAKKIPVKIT